MATSTTETTYMPLDSQSTQDFIDGQVAEADRTGDYTTDFRNALYTVLGLTGGANKYSIDDLWARYTQQVLHNDAGRANTNLGQSDRPRGQHPKHVMPPSFLRNAGNANGFPTGTPLIEDLTNWTLDATWSNTPADNATYDLQGIKDIVSDDPTDIRINCIAWSPDGTLLTIADATADRAHTFRCATPWRPDTVTYPAAVGRAGVSWAMTNPWDIGYSDDGLHLWVAANNSADSLYIVPCTEPYTIPSGSFAGLHTSSERKSDAAFSFSGSTDGPVWVTKDGTRVYWGAQDTSPVIDVYLRTATMSTPWDLDTLSGYDSQISDSSMGAGAGNPAFVTGGTMWIADDGLSGAWMSVNGNWYFTFTLSVAHDLSSVYTRGDIATTQFDNVWGAADANGGVLDSRGKLWVWDDSTTDERLAVFSYTG